MFRKLFGIIHRANFDRYILLILTPVVYLICLTVNDKNFLPNNEKKLKLLEVKVTKLCASLQMPFKACVI